MKTRGKNGGSNTVRFAFAEVSPRVTPDK